mmetsp:Transcript_13547/g.42640  ORF Transcript_13547/g.42640 Transcript_13547/m.42640 type:complete len:216 (+) Transcript_13547:402-1049(+)
MARQRFGRPLQAVAGPTQPLALPRLTCCCSGWVLCLTAPTTVSHLVPAVPTAASSSLPIARATPCLPLLTCFACGAASAALAPCSSSVGLALPSTPSKVPALSRTTRATRCLAGWTRSVRQSVQFLRPSFTLPTFGTARRCRSSAACAPWPAATWLLDVPRRPLCPLTCRLRPSFTPSNRSSRATPPSPFSMRAGPPAPLPWPVPTPSTRLPRAT